MPLHLEIVTPERLVYKGDVDALVCPGIEGELGILPHHAPLLTTLGTGELRIRVGGHEDAVAIAGGFLQVRPDKVVVMAEDADMASDIDLEAAEQARRDVERMISEGFVEAADLARARASMERALLHIRVAERRRGGIPRQRP